MSRKRTKASRPRPAGQPAEPTTLGPGSRVRVKHGTADPDFPDLPLGGWSGTVREVDAAAQPALYLVTWDRRTLARIDPVYRRRCARNDLDLESTWLSAGELEPHDGRPAPLERPGLLTPPPLDLERQDDRVHFALGLTADDPLPAADADSLGRYFTYLGGQLSLPAPGLYQEGPVNGGAKSHPVTVTGLRLAAGEDSGHGVLAEVDLETGHGVLPLHRIELTGGPAARQLVCDYGYWFRAARVETGSGKDQAVTDPEEPSSSGPWTVWRTVGQGAVGGAACGAVLGAIVAVQDDAPRFVGGGALLLALGGFLAGSRYGFFFGMINRMRAGPLVGGLLGALFGSLAGAVAGALAVAYVGALAGCVAGSLTARALKGLRVRTFPEVGWALLGAAAGGLVLAFWQDPDPALTGAVAGAVLGGVVGVLLVLLLLVTLVLWTGARE
jgi:hypothetical protein